MKYDRPVWQIMHLCADAMPDEFRYEDVRTWFAKYYPDVNEATIRAHLIGLTEGGRAKHIQFAPRSPVFRRLARGEYAPIAAAERGERPSLPAAADSASAPVHRALPEVQARADGEAGASVADVILLGSVGDRVDVPAPAKEVYREASFRLSRLDAEVSGSQWFILSAEHGLVAPHEWISPDSRTLADMEPEYRLVWANWVVARLESLVGSLDGKNVHVDAPDAFIGPLFADLQEAGAVVTSGRPSTPERPLARERSSTAERPSPSIVPVATRPTEEVVPISVGAAVSAQLDDVRRAVPASDTSSLPDAPGLYGWFVDPVGARVLNRCLMLPVRAGLVFVGQVGGSSWQTVADPVRNLRDHVDHVQLRGHSHSSTFRMVLATVLREYLAMTSLDDPRLTEWMLQHLSVSTWVSENVASLHALEQLVLSELNPPLNVDHLSSAQYRVRLNQMRSHLA